MADLERAATTRTKALVVYSPGNPSGKVFSRSELEAIAEFATRRDLFVFTDEIYEHFLYDGRSHISPGSIEGMEERMISISGFSKTFSITGWRIGYSVSAARWARRIAHMSDLIYVCVHRACSMVSLRALPGWIVHFTKISHLNIRINGIGSVGLSRGPDSYPTSRRERITFSPASRHCRGKTAKKRQCFCWSEPEWPACLAKRFPTMGAERI